MKIITIGDLHGKSAWKQIRHEDWDHVVFIGDYVDSDEIEDGSIIENLEQIISFKVSFPEKVILLWGNHDLAYFYGGHKKHMVSGFRQAMLPDLFNIFTKHRKFFQAAWQITDHLWTHAGVTREWHDLYFESMMGKNGENLATSINRLFDVYYEPLYHIGSVRGGLYNSGGIFWADKSETEKDPLPGYHQIVGHSKTGNGIVKKSYGIRNTSITYVDCLSNETTFLELEICL